MSTRPCVFFLAGTCRNGAECRFYHEGFSEISRNVLTDNADSTTSTAPTANGGRSTSGISPTSSTLSPSSSPSASTVQTPTSSASPSSPYLSFSTRPAYAASRPCNWYMAGYCLRGDNCWFSHDRTIIEGRSRASDAVEGTDPGQASSELTSTTADASANGYNDGEDENEDQKCAICFEVPSTFGLLVSCNHAFCLTCIRTWRSKNIGEDVRQDRLSVTKACPNCRTQSLFVVPSSYFPATPEQKDIIIQNYKVATARRSCKYFKESGERHWCPFGDDCFFAHLDAQGQPCKVNPQSNPRLNRRRHHPHHNYMGGRNTLRRRAGFESYNSYDDYSGDGYRTWRQRAHRELMEDLAFIQMSTAGVPQNQLEGIQGLLVQLARLSVDDPNFDLNAHPHLRAFSEAIDVDLDDHYDEDGDEDDYDEDEDEDEDADEDEDEDEDDDEDANSETTLERDEREAYEEFSDGLYFQTPYQTSQGDWPSAPSNDDLNAAFYARLRAELGDYY